MPDNSVMTTAEVLERFAAWPASGLCADGSSGGNGGSGGWGAVRVLVPRLGRDPGDARSGLRLE